MKDLPADRVRFGQVELDVRTGELFAVDRTDGSERVLLREQPFQVLRMLIERGGKIVTRDEIKSRLWPNDTFVDFDQSINASIKTLRRALGDSVAEAYAFRNQPDKAFEWLDRAYAQRDPSLGYTKIGPFIKSLHHDPRCAAFLKKLNLPN